MTGEDRSKLGTAECLDELRGNLGTQFHAVPSDADVAISQGSVLI